MVLSDELLRWNARYWHRPDLDLALDLHEAGIEDAWLAEMEPKASRAVQAMLALEAGEIANPDEKRQVGHYWLRDPDRAPTDEQRTAIRAAAEGAYAFAQRVLAGEITTPEGQRFRRVLAMGIGGSALGPQLVQSALAPANSLLEIDFLDNTDPAGFDRWFERHGHSSLAQTLVLVTSKSGGTKETRNAALEVKAAMKERGIAFAPRAVAITGVDSKLDREAKSEGWLARFPMWDWVGGRTSVMSVVGLLPAALQEIDLGAMLDGARRMDDWTRKPLIRDNPALALALAWHRLSNGRGERAMVVLPYKDSLCLFARYLQQLIMESVGKRLNRAGEVVQQGLTVYGNKGSTDQHAFVQQLRDGRDDVFACFVEVLEDRKGPSIAVEPGVTSGDYLAGFLYGTREALASAGRPALTITLRKLDAARLGALIALFERAVGYYAELIDVNAYDQPGVEAGKIAAQGIIELQGRLLEALQSRPGEWQEIPELAKSAKADSMVQVARLCRRLALNRKEVMGSGLDPLRARYRWNG